VRRSSHASAGIVTRLSAAIPMPTVLCSVRCTPVSVSTDSTVT
jgi:hypothetical protein